MKVCFISAFLPWCPKEEIMSGNREYKSDVFSMLMEDRVNALRLYNALNGTDYDDPEVVQICTLDKGVSLSVRNDASFVVDASLSIYEHQSSVCPNMPVRFLIYFSNILERMLKNRNIYGRSLIRIPIPKFAVFYNGEVEQPEQYEIKCPVLREYMIFIDYVREYQAEEGYENLEAAINRAIDRCIEENVLRDFLIEHRSEVVKVTQLDYTFDRQIMLEREEAAREGLSQGLSQGRIEAVRNMISLGVPKEKILEKYSTEEYEKASH